MGLSIGIYQIAPGVPAVGRSPNRATGRTGIQISMKQPTKPKRDSTKKASRGRLAGTLIAAILFYMLLPIYLDLCVFCSATRWDRTILPEGYTLRILRESRSKLPTSRSRCEIR